MPPATVPSATEPQVTEARVVEPQVTQERPIEPQVTEARVIEPQDAARQVAAASAAAPVSARVAGWPGPISSGPISPVVGRAGAWPADGPSTASPSTPAAGRKARAGLTFGIRIVLTVLLWFAAVIVIGATVTGIVQTAQHPGGDVFAGIGSALVLAILSSGLIVLIVFDLRWYGRLGAPPTRL
jgi:hypothetical protein